MPQEHDDIKEAITCSNSLAFQPAPPQNPFTVPSRARHSLVGHPWRCIQWLLRVSVCVCLYQTHSQSIHMHFFHDMWTNLTKLHSSKKNRPSVQVWVSVARIKSPFLQQPILNSIQVDRLLFDLSGVAMANGVFHSDWSPLPWQELRSRPLPPSYPLFWHLSSVPLWLLSPLPWLKVVGRWEWNDQKTVENCYMNTQVVGFLGVGTFHASEISVWVLQFALNC